MSKRPDFEVSETVWVAAYGANALSGPYTISEITKNGWIKLIDHKSVHYDEAFKNKKDALKVIKHGLEATIRHAKRRIIKIQKEIDTLN